MVTPCLAMTNQSYWMGANLSDLEPRRHNTKTKAFSLAVGTLLLSTSPVGHDNGLEKPMTNARRAFFTAIGLGLALAAFAQGAVAQQNTVTAVDIALEPDATMLQHAMGANARLLKSFPKGFALDETHHPHFTMLQQFVRTDDLDKVFAAANGVLTKTE